MATIVKHLQSASAEARHILQKHGTAYGKQLLGQNKQSSATDCALEKSRELPKQLYYTCFSRTFSSQAAFIEGDDRPPSMRKLAAKKEDVVLRAFPRKKTGKIWCKKERRVGLVPSIVFEQENGHLGGNKQLVSVEKAQLENIVNKIGQSFFLSRTYDLEIYDKPGGQIQTKEKVLPRVIHLHSASDELLNVTFIKAPPSVRLKVDIPLVFIGEDSCPGIRKGGYVNTMKRVVAYVCPADAIPPYLEVDLSTLDVGQKILLRDLKVDPRLHLCQKDNSLPVVKIMGTRSMEDAGAANSMK
ncbi:hypothetical protein R1sor_025054 [Riccia sorocarpa]|uniref:Ribosomal protein L25 beta domain-containing protein n=1 Tax=Riccia sorocarpa TaxID=122646 RepID=A0ABD3G906_9MARC